MRLGRIIHEIIENGCEVTISKDESTGETVIKVKCDEEEEKEDED